MRPRLAASVAFRIASGTSRALPCPKPTRPFSSPTTTSAANPKRRPPFTTLATRLMWTSLSVNSLSSRSRPRGSRAMILIQLVFPCCALDDRRRTTDDGKNGVFVHVCPVSSVVHPLSSVSEIKSAFARRIRQRLDAPVIEIYPAVEDLVLDAFRHRPLRDELADRLGGVDIGAGLAALAHRLFERGRRDHGLT